MRYDFISKLFHLSFLDLLAFSLTAARLAQWDKRRRSAERQAVGSNPGRTNTQGL